MFISYAKDCFWHLKLEQFSFCGDVGTSKQDILI